MSAKRLQLLVERLTSLVRSDLRAVAVSHGLKLVQLEALVYLSVANRYSNTPVALTEYFGVTKGTISQTLKTLELRGLIEKISDTEDGRVQHCILTQRGREIATSAYPVKTLERLPADQAEIYADVLEEQLRVLQLKNGSKTFGQCHTCRFFETRAKGGVCGLTRESLSVQDSKKICREHQEQNER